MGKFFLSLICIFLTSYGLINADETTDKQSISNILTEFGTNLSINDFKTVGNFFAFNADIIDPWGRSANGKEKVIDLLKTDIASNYSGDFFRFYVDQIRFLTLDICFVDATITLESQKKEINQASIIFVRQNKEWKILALRWFRFLDAPQVLPEPNTDKDDEKGDIRSNKAKEITAIIK
jgi:hypothetical protein